MPTVAEMLTTIEQRCCYFFLEANQERGSYEPVPEDAKWRVVVYWLTPINGQVFEAATLEEAVGDAWEEAQRRGPWTPPPRQSTLDDIKTSFDGEGKLVETTDASTKPWHPDDDPEAGLGPCPDAGPDCKLAAMGPLRMMTHHPDCRCPRCWWHHRYLMRKYWGVDVGAQDPDESKGL